MTTRLLSVKINTTSIFVRAPKHVEKNNLKIGFLQELLLIM